MAYDPFTTVDCCGFPEVTPEDESAIRFIELLGDDISEVWKTTLNGLVFGNDCQCDIDLLNDFLYLHSYLAIIRQVRINDALNSSDGKDQGSAYYREEYKIDCIREHFYCRGVNINKLLEEENLGKKESTHDGINYMIIESAVDPINRVRGPND